MERKIIVMTLYRIIRETFNLSGTYVLSDNMGIGDVPGWDSLGGINLINAIQSEFDVSFTLEEMSMLNTIENIQKVLIEKGVLNV
jgi:acyl carrier protein